MNIKKPHILFSNMNTMNGGAEQGTSNGKHIQVYFLLLMI